MTSRVLSRTSRARRRVRKCLLCLSIRASCSIRSAMVAFLDNTMPLSPRTSTPGNTPAQVLISMPEPGCRKNRCREFDGDRASSVSGKMQFLSAAHVCNAASPSTSLPCSAVSTSTTKILFSNPHSQRRSPQSACTDWRRRDIAPPGSRSIFQCCLPCRACPTLRIFPSYVSIASLDYVGRNEPITREKCLCRRGFLHSLWDTVGHSVTCHGGGCNGHPAFPTPSRGRKINPQLGRNVPREHGLTSEIVLAV
jgi:hypothetical protein